MCTTSTVHFCFLFLCSEKKKKGKNSHWTGPSPPPFLTICEKKKKVHSEAETLHARFSLGTNFYG